MKRIRFGTMLLPLLLALVVSTSVMAAPVLAGNANQIIRRNPYYVLNILGKKDGWDPQGSFDNPDRHTMFVPGDTALSNPGTYGGQSFAGSVLIWMTSGPEFAVIDGNACDDGNASLQVGPGKYRVFVTALGKPSNENKGENREADLTGWYYDDEGETGTFLYELGSVNIRRNKGNPQPQNVTDLFYIDWADVVAILEAMGMTYDPDILDLLASYGYSLGDPIWIFDFLEILDTAYADTDYYFWQLTNSGLKHIQVRFYEV